MFQLWDDGTKYVPMKAFAAYQAALDAVGLKPQPGFLFRKIVVAGRVI
jgi:hypothetical protein